MKIIDKIREYVAEKRPFFSFEYFPPKTAAGLENLYARIERMARLEPAYIDVTWGAGGSTTKETLDISIAAQDVFGLDVLMHLTCTNQPRQQIDEVLRQARSAGLGNILALRGDPPKGETEWQACADGYRYAAELVQHIRSTTGDTFSVGVGGYPEGHLEATSKEADLKHLKAKVDAGADFIVTQLFYDVEHYRDFVRRCQKAKISVPIIPGVMPIQNYERFMRFTELSRTSVPSTIREQLNAIRDDDNAVKAFGIDVGVKMCQQLIDAGAPGIHFYTLNLESSVTQIVEQLGWAKDVATRRALPWRSTSHAVRQKENVRSIFWSNRPHGYLARTTDWDDFPNGRFSDSHSPTFGDLNDYYLVRRGRGFARAANRDKLLEQWGQPKSVEDIYQVFTRFCRGEIERLPWCENTLRSETSRIAEQLVALNQRGVMTINSQPQVNGVSSTEPDVGWGGRGGYVYQKAYLEFFIMKEAFDALLPSLSKRTSLTYQAVNARGDLQTNVEKNHVNTVTWGVFPGKKIIQPTVVDLESFLIWKDEAFKLWLQDWAALYPPESPSHKIIEHIHQQTMLVNIVENDYVTGDIFAVFGQKP